MILWLPHPAHICCHGYPVMHMRGAQVTLVLHMLAAVVTPSCTRMMPWLCHLAHVCCQDYPGPAHACCRGYPAPVSPWLPPSCTRVSSWLPWLHAHVWPRGPAHVCCRGYLGPACVAMVTAVPRTWLPCSPLPWLPRCCTRLLPW